MLGSFPSTYPNQPLWNPPDGVANAFRFLDTFVSGSQVFTTVKENIEKIDVKRVMKPDVFYCRYNIDVNGF